MVMKAEPILRAVATVTGVDYLAGRSPRAAGTAGRGAEEDAEEDNEAPAREGLAAASDGRFTRGDAPELPADAGGSLGARGEESRHRIVILSPQGRQYDQPMARELSGCDSLVLVCGRYKAIDERVREILGAEELSVGDYVLSGGELGAMVVIESAVRLLPGAMEDEDSAAGDSFEEGLLDSAYYTRPEVVAGRPVPQTLVSGNHEAIRRWRRKSALERTLDRRPDLMGEKALSKEDRDLLNGTDRMG